jgi:hypothetical protein
MTPSVVKYENLDQNIVNLILLHVSSSLFFHSGFLPHLQIVHLIFTKYLPTLGPGLLEKHTYFLFMSSIEGNIVNTNYRRTKFVSFFNLF